ncbi:TonB-dependent receptor domain-containing protein [Paucihalobacter sp.]|uniref:TonB-dependent receptor domain-containing protein n=1 Tax=Paucihalobacter sp. TaxID=2850405 RepID=UPI002FE2A584
MKKSVFFLFLFCFSTLLVSAQKEVKISGKVLEEGTNYPLEYATISFFSIKENKIITGGITNMDGVFEVMVPIDTYNIKVEYISYTTKTYNNKSISNEMNLGTVSLALDAQALDQVEIIAERTTVEIKLDKKVYNVGSDLTVRGGTVSDVLDNVPSVSVDVEGNVALRGNDDVRILINGKPSGLVGLNSTEALRQLPAESIERVEVITSPSARYDAEGTAGIINIILKRSKLQGINGAVTVNVGDPFQAGLSANLNYRTGDFNFFTTTGYNYREGPGNAFSNTNFLNTNNSLSETRDFERFNSGLNSSVGVEWYVNESSSIIASVQIRDSDDSRETTNILREFDSNNSLINTTRRFDPEFEDDKTIQYTLNYDKQFNGDSEHRLTLNFQYETTNEVEASLIEQDDIDVEDVVTDEMENRVFLQGDYVMPIGEVSQFEVGYQGRFITLDTDYAVAFNDGEGNFDLDTNLSNNLIYREYVNAFYSQFGSKIGEKFSFLFGLRLEESRITIDQVTTNDFERKTYANLFPTLNLAYELSEDENITIGINRRIRRPRSRFINPFPSRSSATNLFQGNPDLDPSFSTTYDVGYFKKFGKLDLNTSLYFQNATDVFVFITEETGETAIVGSTEVPVIRRTPVNLATNERFGFEFTLTYRPTKKWNMNGNFNLFQSITKGDYLGTNFDAENLSWFIRLNNKITLPGDIDWQTRLNYRGPSEDAQNINRGIFTTDLAFSKDIFNRNASIALNVSDLFNSRKRITETTTPTFNSVSEFQWRVRFVNLSFTYRFNQQRERDRRERNGGGLNGGDDFDFEG